jgi:hypothetical protein
MLMNELINNVAQKITSTTLWIEKILEQIEIVTRSLDVHVTRSVSGDYTQGD